MDGLQKPLILRNARVIDPQHALDRVTDVVIEAGKIASVGEAPVDPQAEVLDLSGHYLSPGWIDIHVHAYGTLGFSDPDSVGVYHGVTTFVEAGGPGIDTFDEFIAVMASSRPISTSGRSSVRWASWASTSSKGTSAPLATCR